jgi:uncharacterized protein (TIGR03083 family)
VVPLDMNYSRYLDCLQTDYARLRAVAAPELAAAVPTCPGWSVADLTRHVAEVYLHKIKAMQDGVEPEQWPPEGLANEEPLALLDRAYAQLRHEFATRQPGDAAGGWYKPDRSVGFWARRMAQETVIHRIDAELGAGQPVQTVPNDLAIDGIDELLKVFVEYSVKEWGKYFTEILSSSPGHTFSLQTEGAAWRVSTAPGLFSVADGADNGAEVSVSAEPTTLLRWVWNREGPDTGVSIEGPQEAVTVLKRCITAGTQ